jgi:hypothetical protein
MCACRGILSVSLQWSEAIFIFVLADQMVSWCLSSVTWHILIIFSIELDFLETLNFLAFWRKTRRILESILEWSKPRDWKIRIWCKRGSCTHVWNGEGGEEANVYYLQIDPTICTYDGSKILVQSSHVLTYWSMASTTPPQSSGNTTTHFPSICS